MNNIDYKNQYKLVADRLGSVSSILAVTHISPDGDALGSLTFFNLLAKALKINCTMYCAGPLPMSLQFLPDFKNIITDQSLIDFKNFEAIVTLDCATLERSGIASHLYKKEKSQIFIEIDHHPAPASIADLSLRVVEAASTTQVLFDLAKVMKIEIDPLMAKSLLTGIVTDTNSFIHPTATNETIAAAANIVSRGASLARLNDQASKTKTLASLHLWGKILSRLERNKKYNFVYTIITKDDFENGVNYEDAIEGIAGFLAGIDGAQAIMVLREEEGNIRGSLRTTKDNIDMNRLARALGGGGHKKASGFKFPGYLVCENGVWQVKYK